MSLLEVGPTDILAVWTGNKLSQNLIRAGAALAGKPAVANHVVVVTHQDRLGRWMGIEGRPGGVGPVDCTRFLRDRRTRVNHAQPRDVSKGQDTVFLASCAKSLGIAYDWVGIAEDALTDCHLHDLAEWIDPLWRWRSGQLPGHVVCSSLAAELYDLVGWAHPSLQQSRKCDPSDWWDWSDRQGWPKLSLVADPPENFRG